jgi:hypothetical protein
VCVVCLGADLRGGGDSRWAAGHSCPAKALSAVLQCCKAGRCAPLQCRVPLYVLAVFVKCGGTNALQLSPRQGRLEQVADVQAAAAATTSTHSARTDERVHLRWSRGRGRE